MTSEGSFNPYSRPRFKYIDKVPQEVREEFLSRKLPDDFHRIKELSIEQLNERIRALDPPPDFNIPLFKHQKAMFLLGLNHPNVLYLADMGTGKTGVALNLIAYQHKIGNLSKALVLIPDIANFKTWEDECKKFTPHLRLISVYGKDREERIAKLQEEADIYVMNYTGLHVILSQPGFRARVINPTDVSRFASQFDCIVLDEIVAVKNPRSVTFQICNVLSKSIPYRYGLTGRPFGRNPIDLWAQFFVIDGGETLGRKLALFRESFFDSKDTAYGTQWKVKKELEPQLFDIIRNRSIRYATEECVDLPQRMYNVIRLPLYEEAASYYDRIGTEFINMAVGSSAEPTTIPVVKNHFIKLRQICSGFLRFRPDGAEIDEDIVFDTPKDTIIEQLAGNLPEGCKMLIFHEFTVSGRRITAKLKDMKIGHRWLYGGTPDKTSILEDFNTNPRTRVLVLNSHSGAMGLNLQVANYVTFYESPVSPIVRAQAEKRAHRTGQTRPVYFYDLVTQNSVEERIMQFLQEGDDLFKAIVEGRVRRQDVVGILEMLRATNLKVATTEEITMS